MKVQAIAAATGMGAVDLAVTDADRARRFYRDYVGLTPLPSDGPEIHMGAAGRELVVLHPGAERPVVPRTSGLYHLAVLVPDRRELARVIGRLARLQWDQYPTDHVMTKANYLWDPDGNGIEIYTESPEDGTMGIANGAFVVHDKDGRERSGREPIDLDELFTNLQPDDRVDAPMPRGTKMGHVHLHVADVENALRFYHDLLGFDVMGHIPGVGFVSAGGYHHHLGLNEWAGHERATGAGGLGGPPPLHGRASDAFRSRRRCRPPRARVGAAHRRGRRLRRGGPVREPRALEGRGSELVLRTSTGLSGPT